MKPKTKTKTQGTLLLHVLQNKQLLQCHGELERLAKEFLKYKYQEVQIIFQTFELGELFLMNLS